jgi:hypothetical protein
MTQPNFKLAAAAFSGTSTPTPVKVIDLSEKSLKPNIVREGVQVPVVTLDPDLIKQIVRPDTLIDARESSRVVSQSIPPGTRVKKGATIDLVLAARFQIPVSVISGAHKDLAPQNLDQINKGLLIDPIIADVVKRFEKPEDVPVETRTALEERLKKGGVTLDPADPGRTYAAAFNTLKGASAFR